MVLFLLAPLTSLQAIDLYDILFNDKSKTYYGNLPLIPLSGGVPIGRGGRKKPPRHGFACHPSCRGEFISYSLHVKVAHRAGWEKELATYLNYRGIKEVYYVQFCISS